MADGSKIVVEGGSDDLGQQVRTLVVSVLPTAGGKRVFARYPGAVS